MSPIVTPSISFDPLDTELGEIISALERLGKLSAESERLNAKILEIEIAALVQRYGMLMHQQGLHSAISGMT